MSTSRCWALREERQSRYELVRMGGPGSFGAAARLARESGFAVYETDRFVGWRFPEQTSEAERLAFFDLLAGID